MYIGDVSGEVLPPESEPQFLVSSYCGGGACVEVAPLADGRVAVRSSKYPGLPALVYSSLEWRDFIAGVKKGEFDFTEGSG